MNELVSIIVPVYNVQEYIDRCVESLVKQTYENIEIILVNDGSTDNSLELLENWEKKDNRVVIVNKANGGLSDARNAGIKAAKGDYFFFIDSDDFVDITMCEKMMASLKEHDSDIVVCDMKYLYDDGEEKFASGGDFVCESVKENPSFITINNSACNKLYKRELFNDAQFPVGRYYEDLALIPSLLYKAKRVSKVNEPFYVYYQRKGSIAHSANKKIFHIYDAIKDDIDYVKNHGNEQDVIEELKHFYIIHGLDLTTLRIKDFDDKEVRVEYLKENMKCLKAVYPDYKKDSAYKSAGFKKKIVFMLLDLGLNRLVLRLYD